MIEIRPIVQEEAPEFLHLLCSAFDLDEARASTVFYREPYFDLDRKWALFLDGQIASILTTTPLLFGWGKAVGIAGVATKPKFRRNGYAEELISETLRHGLLKQENAALLFATKKHLYERCGFKVIDEVVRGFLRESVPEQIPEPLSVPKVQAIYNAWASQDPHRLIRDDQRWTAWNWMHRVCEPFGDGYLCLEANLLREAIVTENSPWPVNLGTEWIGLRNMTRDLRVPIGATRQETWLLGKGFDQPPQMFLTDQF